MTLPPVIPQSSAPEPPPAAAGEDPRIGALERQLAEQAHAHKTRLAQSELRLHAVRAGMIDLDGLKLLDASQVRLTEAGEVEGADRLMADLRRDKPWLFQHATTSTPGAAPPSAPPAPKTAMQMNEAEWQAARAVLLRRR